MSVPRLRFKEFIGGWEVKKVGVICDFIVPGRNKPTEFEGDIPWITTPDIEQNGIVLYSKKNLNITREEAKNIGSKIVPKNSIIISCVGELGLVAISGTDLIINQQLHAFIPKENIYFRFLLYALTIQKPYMEKIATKTAVPYMNKDNCNSIPVIMPSLPEQTKIANFLTAVDEKIAQLTQKSDLLASYKKGVMQQIFSQQLRFKDDDGVDFPDWVEKNLEEAINNYGGTSLEEFVNIEGSHNFISIGNYEKTGNYYDNGQRIVLNNKTKLKLLNKNDLVMVLNDKTASGDLIGATILISEDNKYIYNQRSERLVCKLEMIRPKYAWHFLNSYKFRKEIFSISQGATQIYVNFPAVKKLIIPLPCLEEQTKIAKFLTALDDKITHNQTQLNALKHYKQGLLQQLFV